MPRVGENKNDMLRIESAIAIAKDNGKKVLKKDIAARLWPDVSEVGRRVNMTNLCSGKTDRVRPEWVSIICEMTGCTADFLCGIE